MFHVFLVFPLWEKCIKSAKKGVFAMSGLVIFGGICIIVGTGCQYLIQKLTDLQISMLDDEVASLRERLEKLEQIVGNKPKNPVD